MKPSMLKSGWVASLLWLGTGAALAVPTPNGGFETGDFTSWSVTVPPGGSAEVVPLHLGENVGDSGHGGPFYWPVEGEWFAALKTDGPGTSTSISQSLALAAGQTVSGWAAFDFGDVHGVNDSANVRILNSGGQLVATPWAKSGLDSEVTDFWDGPWTYWSWTPSAAGTYTLVYSAVNSDPVLNDSYALFEIGRAHV